MSRKRPGELVSDVRGGGGNAGLSQTPHSLRVMIFSRRTYIYHMRQDIKYLLSKHNLEQYWL